MPPQVPGVQFADDGPPEFVKLLSAAVAKQRRATARTAAKAAKQEQQRQEAAAVGGRVLVLRDDGASSHGSSGDSDDEFELTEAEAAAMGWEATAEVLANMHTASDATAQRAEITKQNRRVRRTLAQVQRRVERTVKDFRKRTAELRAEVDSDEEDILGSMLREQVASNGGGGGLHESKGGSESQRPTKGDTGDSLPGSVDGGSSGARSEQDAEKRPATTSVSLAEENTAGLSLAAAASAKRRAAAQRKASATRGAQLMAAKIGNATPALRRRHSGRQRRSARRGGGDSGSSDGDSQEEAAILDRMFGVGDNVDGDIAVGRSRLRSQLEATATGNERETDRRRGITRRARRDIQELLQLRAARSAAQSHTLHAVLHELRQYHSVDQRSAAQPAPMASLAATDVMLQQVETDIAAAQETLWNDTRSLGGVFEASKGLFARLLEQAADGAQSAKLKDDIKTLQEALGKHGDTIEKLLSKLHMTESRLQRAQRSTAGKATHMEMLEKRVKEHDALVKTLRADISAKDSAAVTLRETLAELREQTVSRDEAAQLRVDLLDAQEQVRILEERNKQANMRMDGMQEEALRLRMAATMAAKGGAGGGSLAEMQSAVTWASSRVSPLQYQRALSDFSSLFHHLQWSVREVLLVLRGSARERAAHVLAPALARLRDSTWREDIESSVGADAPMGSMGPGADVADRVDRLLVRGWFMEEQAASVHSAMDLLTLLGSMGGPEGPVPDVPGTPTATPSLRHARSGFSRSMNSPVRAVSRSSGGGSSIEGGASPRPALSLDTGRPRSRSPKHREVSDASAGGGSVSSQGGGFPPRAPPSAETDSGKGSPPQHPPAARMPAGDKGAPLTPPAATEWTSAAATSAPPVASGTRPPRKVKPRPRPKGGRRGSIKGAKAQSSPPRDAAPAPAAGAPVAEKTTVRAVSGRRKSPPRTPISPSHDHVAVTEVDAPSTHPPSKHGSGKAPSVRDRTPITARASTAEAQRQPLVSLSSAELSSDSDAPGPNASMKVVGRTVVQGQGSPREGTYREHSSPTVLTSDAPLASGRGGANSPLYIPQADMGGRNTSSTSSGSLQFKGEQSPEHRTPTVGGGRGIAALSPEGRGPPGQRRLVRLQDGKGPDSGGEGPRRVPIPKSPPPRAASGSSWGEGGVAPGRDAAGVRQRRPSSLDPMALDLEKLGVTFGGDTTVVVVRALQRRVRTADDTIATLQAQVHALRKKLATREGVQGGLQGVIGAPLALQSRQGTASHGAMATAEPHNLATSRSTPLYTLSAPPLAGDHSSSVPVLPSTSAAGSMAGGSTLHPALERLSAVVGSVHAAAVVAAGAGSSSVGEGGDSPHAAPAPAPAAATGATAEGNLYKLSSARLQLQGSLAEVHTVLQAVAKESSALRAQLLQAKEDLEQVRSKNKQDQRMAVHRTERDVAFALQEQLVEHVRKLEAQFQASLAKAVRRLVASKRPTPLGSATSSASLQGSMSTSTLGDDAVKPHAGSYTTSVKGGKGGSGARSAKRQPPMLHPEADMQQSHTQRAHSGLVLGEPGSAAMDSSAWGGKMAGTAPSMGDIDPSAPPSAPREGGARPSFGAFVTRRREAYQLAAGVEPTAPGGDSTAAPSTANGQLQATGTEAQMSPREQSRGNPSLFAHHRGKPKLRRGVQGGPGNASSGVPAHSLSITPVAPVDPKPHQARPADLARVAASLPGSTSHSDPFSSSSHFTDTAVQRRAIAALPKNRRPAAQEPRPPTDAMMGGVPSSPSPVSPPPSSRGRMLSRSPAADGVVAPPRLIGRVPVHGTDDAHAASMAQSWIPPRQGARTHGRVGGAADGPMTPSSTFEMTFSRTADKGVRGGISWGRGRGDAHEGGYASDGGGGLSATLAAKTRLIHSLVLAGSSEYGIYRHLKAKYEGEEHQEAPSPPSPLEKEEVPSASRPRPLLLSPTATEPPPQSAQLEMPPSSSAVPRLPVPPAGPPQAGGKAPRGPLAVRIAPKAEQHPPAVEQMPPTVHPFEGAVAALQAVGVEQIPSLVAAAGRSDLMQSALAPSAAGAMTTSLKARPRAASPLRSSTPGGGHAVRSDTADSRSSSRSKTPLYAAVPSAAEVEAGTAAGRTRRGLRHATMHTLWLLVQWHGSRVQCVTSARAVERLAWMRRQLVLSRQCSAIEEEVTAAEVRQRELESGDPAGELGACKRSAAALRLALSRAQRLRSSFQEVHEAREALLTAQLSSAQAAAMGVLSKLAGGDGSDAPPLPLLDADKGGGLASPFLAPQSAQRTVTPVPRHSSEHPFVQNMPLSPREGGVGGGYTGRPRTAPVGNEPMGAAAGLSSALLNRSDITAVLDGMPPVLATPTGGSAITGAEQVGAGAGGVLARHANSAWQLLTTHLQRTAVDASTGMGVHAEDGRLPALGVALAAQDRYSMALQQEHTSPVLLSLAVPALPASMGGVSLLSDTVHSRSLLPRGVVNRLVAALPFLPLGTQQWAHLPLWGQARVMLDMMEFALLGAPPRVVAATVGDQHAHTAGHSSGQPGTGAHIVPAARLRDPWSNVNYRVFGQPARPGASVAESAAALEGGALMGDGGAPTYQDKVNAARLAQAQADVSTQALVPAASGAAADRLAHMARPTAAFAAQTGEKSKQNAFGRALVVKHSQDVEAYRQAMLRGVMDSEGEAAAEDGYGRAGLASQGNGNTLAARGSGTAAVRSRELSSAHSRRTGSAGGGARGDVLSKQGVSVPGYSSTADVAVTHVTGDDVQALEELHRLRRHHGADAQDE